jgi:hypothetical protein
MTATIALTLEGDKKINSHARFLGSNFFDKLVHFNQTKWLCIFTWISKECLDFQPEGAEVIGRLE